MSHTLHKTILAAILAMFAVLVNAHDFKVGGIYYKIKSSEDLTVYVTYRGSDYYSYSNEYTGNITIPESVTYNGKTYVVTSIGGSAFRECSSLKSVTISNSVTSIGDGVFYDCTGLTSVTIEDGTTDLTFGSNVFYNAPLQTLYFGRNSSSQPFRATTTLTSLTIGSSVTSIGSYAFYQCVGLTSVDIPDGVTSIGNYAFSQCTGLAKVTISNSVTRINSYAFDGCSIKKVIWLGNTPPSGYTNLESAIHYVGNALYTDLSSTKVYPYLTSMFEVDGIKYVPVSPSERTCDAIDCVYSSDAENTVLANTVTNLGITFNVDTIQPYLCYNNDNIKTIHLNFDENIPDYAFFGCDSLTDATLDEGIESIGHYGFANCSRLVSVVLPNTLTSLGTYAFQRCSRLTSVTIGSGLTAIEAYTFMSCSSLPSISIPNNVTTIGNDVFVGCSSLSSVTFADRETELSLGYNTSRVSDNITTYGIRNPLFADCPLETVYIGGNITYGTSSSERYSPFYRNTTLETVTINDKETGISENEFYGCSGLKSITMGNSVESIGNWAFSGCSNLESFSFGSGMKTIGQEAFSDCTALTSLTSHAATPPTCGENALTDINKWTCTLHIPEGTSSLYQAADQWKDFFFISDDATGIASTTSSASATEASRYNMSGQRIQDAQRGVNIIRMSDGSIRKVLVK